MKNEIVHIINNSFSLQSNENNFVEYLTEKINYLIVHDFNKLVYILYRADINEQKLNRMLLENNKKDAGKIIAALFIERQLQKINSREENQFKKTDDSEEERW